MNQKSKPHSAMSSDVVSILERLANQIDYGQIVIKIQDGKIVQIDSLERTRIVASRKDLDDNAEYHI